MSLQIETNSNIDLNKLKNVIETLDKKHHIHILKIIYDSKEKYSENKNGTFINLSNLSQETLSKIVKQLTYIKQQNITLDIIESVKKDIKLEHFA
tara:strand:+ start:82 stop:366 length:285 start_codon:yes stop_codon:yes gene_type:complete